MDRLNRTESHPARSAGVSASGISRAARALADRLSPPLREAARRTSTELGSCIRQCCFPASAGRLHRLPPLVMAEHFAAIGLLSPASRAGLSGPAPTAP